MFKGNAMNIMQKGLELQQMSIDSRVYVAQLNDKQAKALKADGKDIVHRPDDLYPRREEILVAPEDSKC
jgi:hypothetical protein